MIPIYLINVTPRTLALPTRSSSSVKSGSGIELTSEIVALLLICDAWRNRGGNAGDFSHCCRRLVFFFFCERRHVLGKIPRRRSRNWLPSSPALISNGGYVYCDRWIWFTHAEKLHLGALFLRRSVDDVSRISRDLTSLCSSLIPASPFTW